MKYIEIHIETNRVHRVEDVLPSNSKEASLFIECPNDEVQVGWWLDAGTETLHEEKIWTKDEVRFQRDILLTICLDWIWRDEELAATDNIAQTPDFPNRDKYLTYRQALRDMPSNADPILDSTWPKYPDRWATRNSESDPDRLLESGEDAT